MAHSHYGGSAALAYSWILYLLIHLRVEGKQRMVFVKICIPIIAGVLLVGCSAVGGGSAAPQTRGVGDALQNEVTHAKIAVITDSPDQNAQRRGRYTVFERVNCTDPRQLEAAFSASVDKLRAEALADSADMLRVLGTGDLRSRGLCNDSRFQLTGVAFSESAVVNGRESGGVFTQADSLTSRLEELEALRDRNLITSREYEQLRSRVLESAF